MIRISPRGIDVKREIIGRLDNEAIVTLDELKKAIGIPQFYSVERFVEEGLPLPNGEILRCLPLFNEGAVQEYRVYVDSSFRSKTNVFSSIYQLFS